jgi:hypothetical protein
MFLHNNRIPSLAENTPKTPLIRYSSGGFDSLTAKKDLADRICHIGKPTVIQHLGDYDPSGASMFEVVAEDVAAFVESDKPWPDVWVDFYRVALSITGHSLQPADRTTKEKR